MVGLLVQAGKIRDGAALLEALKDREKKMSTGVGEGIALPHCASPELAARPWPWPASGRGWTSRRWTANPCACCSCWWA